MGYQYFERNRENLAFSRFYLIYRFDATGNMRLGFAHCLFVVIGVVRESMSIIRSGKSYTKSVLTQHT